MFNTYIQSKYIILHKGYILMDITKFMILIRGEDKTAQIDSFSRDEQNKKIIINYQNGYKSYLYDEINVKILETPEIIALNGRTAYIEDISLYKPQCILDFGEKIRIIQYNGIACTIDAVTFSIVENSADKGNSQQILQYLQEIAQYTTEQKEEETFLKQEMKQLTFVHPESVLSQYLLKKPVKTHPIKIEDVIFPFSFNLSQRTALEQALTHSISVIEGPPGSGKTQTILNILANLVLDRVWLWYQIIMRQLKT